MLDSTKKYFVFAGTLLRSTLESWANENTMKLIGEEISLPRHGRVFELDVQYNEDLRVPLKLLGSGHPDFRNGRRVIGRACHDTICGQEIVVVYPEIRDR